MEQVFAYKVNSLIGLKPNSFAYLKVPGENKFEIYVTDKEGVPYALKQVSAGVQSIENTDGSITITGFSTKNIKVSDGLQLLINNALQPGDNTSNLINNGSDGNSTYVETDELAVVAFSGDYNDLSNLPTITGSTNLDYIASPINGTVTSDTGTDAIINLANTTNAGLLSPTDKTKLNNTSGVNTGDQDLSGKLDKVSAPKIVYATDNSNNQTTIQYSSGSSLNGTIVQRTPEGQVQSLTLLDSDVNATSNDLINRNYVQSLRNDRIAQVTLSNGGVFTPSSTDDGVILSGSTVASYTINLPSGYSKYKRFVIKFRAGVTNLVVNPGLRPDLVTPNTIDWYPTSVKAKYCLEYGYNWSSYDWEIISYYNDDVPPVFSNVVYVNSNDPNTATIFDLNNPPTVNSDSLKVNVNNLYIGLNSSTWTYNSSTSLYTTYTAVGTDISNFFFSGTSIPAGNNKTSAIKRSGSIETTGNKVTGGTSSQFQKGDGSLDSNSYENTTNKSNSVSDVASTTKFPVWAIIITWIKENLISALPAKATTLVDADYIVIGDSADSNKTKTRTFLQLITTLGTRLALYFQTIPTLVTNSATTGVYNLDYSFDTWNLILTGNTTFTESNLPAAGKTKVISIYVTGNFILTFPAGWSGNIKGAYVGTLKNQIVVEYLSTGIYWITITQPS